MNELDALKYVFMGVLAEALQEVMKAQQFGIATVYEEVGSSNGELIHQELHDVLAILEMLDDEGFLIPPTCDEGQITRKKGKVNHYWEKSKALGRSDGT